VFIGNQEINNLFEKVVLDNGLAQVYCFSGLDQVGKKTMAIKMASQLLGTKEEEIDRHSDFYFLNRGLDEKTGKERRDISVSQIRTLRSFLQNQSWQGGWRIVVIDDAEFLNEESGNALLKSLEEPGGKTIFFLLTRNDDSLLPTIRSRSEVWQFLPVSEEEIIAGLVAVGCGEELANRISFLSSGRPGRAIEFFRDENKLRNWEEEIARWHELWKKPLHERMKSLESIIGEKDESESKEIRLQKIINVWIEEGRRMLREEIMVMNRKDNLSLLLKVIDVLGESRDMLRQNINAKMIMEKIMLQF